MKLIAVLLGLAICQIVLSNPVKRAADCGCQHDGTTYVRDINETWVDDCKTYKCASHENVVVTEYKCSSGDPQDPTRCHSVSQTWTVIQATSCVHYECNDPGAPYAPYRKIIDLDCVNQGQCVNHGDSWPSLTTQCLEYTCNVNMSTLYVSYPFHSTGCASLDTNDPPGTCKAVDHIENQQVPSGEGGYCLSYTCIQPVNPQTLPSYQFTSLACRWQGECYGDGESWDDGVCQRKTCSIDNFTYGTSSSYTGCLVDGDCKAEDDTWSECSTLASPNEDRGTCSYFRCDLDGTEYSPEVTSTVCTLDGIEYDMNDWRLRTPTSCQYATCFYDPQGIFTYKLQTHCKDCDGNCHEFGSSGWPYYVDGVRKEDCTCNPSDPAGGPNVYTCV